MLLSKAQFRRMSLMHFQTRIFVKFDYFRYHQDQKIVFRVNFYLYNLLSLEVWSISMKEAQNFP